MKSPRVFEIPGFGPYCFGQFGSIVGTGMQVALIPWYVESCTGSAFDLTLVALTTAASLCLLPYGGVIADKYDRWTILVISQVIALFQAAALGFIALTGEFNLYAVLGLNFLAGTITAFEFPARHGLKSDLAGEELLGAVLRFYSSVDLTAFRVGLAIGGIMIVSFSSEAAPLCFFINAASYLAALWALLVVRPQVASKAASHKASETEPKLSIMEGWQLVCSDSLLRLLVLQAAIVVLFCNGLDPLLPAFAKEGLNNVDYVGWLRIATIVGAVLGGYWTHNVVTEESQLLWSYRTLAALPVVLLVLFVAPGPVSASLAMVAASALFLVQETCSLASMQVNTAPALRGRVASWRGSVNWGLAFLVTLPLGWAATEVGVRPVLITCAALGLPIALGLWHFAAPRKGDSVRRITESNVSHTG